MLTNKNLSSYIFLSLIYFAPLLYASEQKVLTGFTVPTTPVLPETEVHPCLYFYADDIPILSERKTNSNYSHLWGEIQGDVDKYRGANPQQQDENDRPRMAKTLAFWWLLENDAIARNNAIAALMLAFDGVPQTGDKPYDEIYRATWLQNYCAAYDWIYDQLTVEQDSIIRAKIARETQFLRDNLTDGKRLAPRPHNHRSKPAWAICTAALTLSEHPNAADWLEYGLIQANTVTEEQFTSDGIYKEGGHYWVYSAVNFIPFLWHYFNVAGVDLFPYYKPAFIWPVAVRTGQGWIPNIEDSYIKPAPTHFVATAYQNTSTEFHSYASLGNILQWNFKSANIFTNNYTGATNDVTWEIDEFIFYDDTIVPIVPDCNPTIKLDGGQVIFRNRWEGGVGHRYLVFHGPQPGTNHDHPDQLSFVLEADDGYVIADAGYGSDGFSDDKRESWYTTAKAHNIVTANYYVPFFIPNKIPPTPYFIQSDFFDFAEKQIDFTILGSVTQRRAISLIAKKYWVVTDILAGGNESTFYQLYLHGRGEFVRQNNQASWTAPAGLYGNQVRLDTYLFPKEANITDETGYISMFKDARAEQYVVMDQQQSEALFMQILIPNNPFHESPIVTNIGTTDILTATVESGDTTDLFSLKLDSELKNVYNISTDGTFGWTRTIDTKLQHIAFREATSYVIDSEISISINGQATMAIDFSKVNKLELFTSLYEDTLIVQIEWLNNAPIIDSVFVDGINVKFSQSNSGNLTIMLSPDNTNVEYSDNEFKPNSFTLLKNYPNPFTSSTNILFKTPCTGNFVFLIYNILGQKIWEKQIYTTGKKFSEIKWDGSDINDVSVPSGIYFGRLLDHNRTNYKQVKMILVR